MNSRYFPVLHSTMVITIYYLIYRMAGNLREVLIFVFVVNFAVMKITTHEN